MPPLAQTTLPVHHLDSGPHSIPTNDEISSGYAGRPIAFLMLEKVSLGAVLSDTCLDSWRNLPRIGPQSFCTCSPSTSFRIFASGANSTIGCKPAGNSSLVVWNISVITGPGLIATTVARSLISRDQVRVIASKAALVPPYTDWSAQPFELDVLETLIIRPERSFGRYGSAACMRSKGAKTLTWYEGIISFSRSMLPTAPIFKIPALLMIMSMVKESSSGFVKCFFACSTSFDGAVGSERFAWTGRILILNSSRNWLASFSESSVDDGEV